MLLSLNGCGSTQQQIPQWNGKIYSYQTNDLSFERTQDGEIIPYNNPKANGMLCFTPCDLQSLLDTYVVGISVPGCIQPSPTPTNIQVIRKAMSPKQKYQSSN